MSKYQKQIGEIYNDYNEWRKNNDKIKKVIDKLKTKYVNNSFYCHIDTTFYIKQKYFFYNINKKIVFRPTKITVINDEVVFTCTSYGVNYYSSIEQLSITNFEDSVYIKDFEDLVPLIDSLYKTHNQRLIDINKFKEETLTSLFNKTEEK